MYNFISLTNKTEHSLNTLTNFLINTGLYVFSPKILNLLPLNKKYNMNELINDAKRTKKKIGVFKINNNSWVDIGQWNDYKAALKKIKNQKEI